MMKFLTGLCFLLSASSLWAQGDAVQGEQSFSKCSACHNIESPRTRLGPHLMGVVGRHAGSVPDYKYSQAMTDAGASGLIWDEDKLRAFLSSPKKVVPGTSMRFFGLWSETEIDNLIAYLKTVSAPQ
nr:cytochrome c family protein [Agrobacterium sp. rho-13.3]MDX8306518.1 cytochrome c family protein [Agrobacterium sp. rho-13.3]MDX8307151.1 cytochrome c family protein [Agrobacterium sp. rho-13.3]